MIEGLTRLIERAVAGGEYKGVLLWYARFGGYTSFHERYNYLWGGWNIKSMEFKGYSKGL